MARKSFQQQLTDNILNALSENEYKENRKKDINGKKSKTSDDPVGISVGHSPDISVGTSPGHRVEYSTPQPIQIPTQILTEKPGEIPTQEPSQIPTQKPGEIPTQTPSQIPTEKPILVENEVILYTCLKHLNGRTTTMPSISRETGGISTDTLRGCLKRLRKKGMIQQYDGLKNEAGQVGFSAKVAEREFILRGDEKKLKQKLEGINYSNLPILTNQLDNQVNDQVKYQVNNQLDNQVLSSSSLFLKNNTTSKATEILETDIELGYWRQKNLSPKQFLSWLKLFNDDIDLLIESLSYCAFAMVDLKEEKEKPVRNVFSWFFKIVEKTGSYPKPKGYKSCRQKLIENKERVLKEKKEEIERLEKLNKEESELNQELEYQRMFQNKEGEDYKWCFNRLNDFTKKLPETHSVFRTLMKKAFDELQVIKQISELSKDESKENQELIEEYKKSHPELVELVLEKVKK